MNLPLEPGKWMSLLTECVCLAIIACHEFIEWWTVRVQSSTAKTFLGTQGDVWYSHWDMLFATISDISAILALS